MCTTPLTYNCLRYRIRSKSCPLTGPSAPDVPRAFFLFMYVFPPPSPFFPGVYFCSIYFFVGVAISISQPALLHDGNLLVRKNKIHTIAGFAGGGVFLVLLGVGLGNHGVSSR